MATENTINSGSLLVSQIDAIDSELEFISRQQTERYPIIELSHREFDYNQFSTDILCLIQTLLETQKSDLEIQLANL